MMQRFLIYIMPVDPYKCHFNSFILNSCLCYWLKTLARDKKLIFIKFFCLYQVKKTEIQDIKGVGDSVFD